MPILSARAWQRTLRPCLVAGEDLEPLGRLLLWRTVPLGRGLGVHGRGATKRKADRMSLPPIWAQPTPSGPHWTLPKPSMLGRHLSHFITEYLANAVCIGRRRQLPRLSVYALCREGALPLMHSNVPCTEQRHLAIASIATCLAHSLIGHSARRWLEGPRWAQKRAVGAEVSAD
jgi:hypothetical protein